MTPQTADKRRIHKYLEHWGLIPTLIQFSATPLPYHLFIQEGT